MSTKGKGGTSTGVQKNAANKGGKLGPPCPRICNLVPIDVPGPGDTNVVLHPRKDVFVLKVPRAI